MRVLHIEPADVGHNGVNRERIYVILSHRIHTTEVMDPHILLGDVVTTIRDRVATRPSDYFVSSKEEILRVAADLAHSRKKRLRTAPSFS